VYASSQDRNLYAINVATGKQVWSVALDAAGLYTPILENGTIYLSTLAKQVVAINPKNGEKLWTANLSGTVFGSPVLVGKNLFIADESSKLYAFAASNGAKVGEWATPGPVTATVAAFSKGVLVVCEAGDVIGFSEAGEKIFSQKINGKLYTRPVQVQDVVVVAVTAPSGGQIDKLLVAYDSTGKEAWSLPVPK
jgi:outer membrane protein assembly factor BamB